MEKLQEFLKEKEIYFSENKYHNTIMLEGNIYINSMDFQAIFKICMENRIAMIYQAGRFQFTQF